MKTKTFAILFALVMVLSMAVGVYAQDFTETWDENTVLTVFNDLDMYFPDMFADEDSDFLWVDNGPADYPSEFANKTVAKAPIDMDIDEDGNITTPTLEAKYDPCGDGMIKYDMTIDKMPRGEYSGYYGDENTTYIRNIAADLTVVTPSGSSFTYKLGVKTCDSTGGDGCHSVTFKKKDGNYQAHLKGYFTVPYGVVMSPKNADSYLLDMRVDFSTYMTALWDVTEATVYAETSVEANSKKVYCQPSLKTYDAFGYETRAAYDENTGEARLQVVVRNFEAGPEDLKKQNYVIPGDVFAYVDPSSIDLSEYDLPIFLDDGAHSRITGYTCKYTVFNVSNAAPRTEYCKFGEGIAIPNHGMVRIDITIDDLGGDILRAANGSDIPFALRLGGMTAPIFGEFEPVEFPCPKVSRMQVMDPLKPFMSFYNVLKGNGAIKPSGAYGVYEGGVWGMYQKCGKMAYMMVRLKNDGLDDEVVNLDHTAVAINGGTPMKWNWVMTTVDPEKGNKIVLPAGEDVILIGRAKVTDIPSQLNADTAMTGAVNFTDFGFYITGKVYSDHNNTRCVAAPK